MTEYDNTNTGVLYINTKDDDPPLTGKLFIGQDEHWFDGWTNDVKDHMDVQFRKKNTRGDNKGKGSLKKQDKDGKSEKYPDWKGSITTAGGQEFWISGWRREPSGKAKYPYVTFKIEPKEERPSQGESRRGTRRETSGQEQKQKRFPI